MRAQFFAIVLTTLAAAPLAAQQQAAREDACPRPPGPEAALAPAAVAYLADDALAGRLAGSAGERCAGDYIAAVLRRLGLEPAGQDGGFFQEVPLASQIGPHAPGGTGRNIVALLPGTDSGLADEPVVIGAHYDHLGRGPFGSLAPDSVGAIHNGADDNASGVAALLVAARELAAGSRPARPMVFIAFTGEEFGLLGSGYWAADPTVPGRPRAMLNLDMVGRLGTQPLVLSGTGTAEEWDDILLAVREPGDPAIAANPDGYGPSDHTSFYSRDIPALHFFTNTHADYHRPSDDAARVDLDGVERIGGLVARIALRLAGERQPLTLVRGAGTPPAQRASGGHGAHLGVVPDFAPVERGVRISGVGAGSPAERTGLRGGDVIIGMGERPIGDLYDLTDALQARRPGDRVRITVLRDGAELVLEAVLGKR